MRRKRATSSATDSGSPYAFDARAADKAVSFIETYCSHVKGEKAGQPFILAAWQRTIVRDVFGWKRRSDSTRRYRTLYLSCARKQGKSSLSGAIALYLLLADGEPGAEIVSAAADREQAAIIFDIARLMVEQHADLRARVAVYRRSIVVPKTGSSYKVISAEAYSKYGLNLSGAMVDELHAHESRELLDVLLTSMGARRQPLAVITTTAGHDRHSVCYEVHQRAEQIRAGILTDPSLYPAIYAAALDDDWTVPATWAKANPGLGESIKLDFLEGECRRAQETPGYVNTFRRLHCNQWVESASRWLDMAAWDDCAGAVDPAALRGRPCYGGLDLSTTTDLSAFVLVFPDDGGGYDVLTCAWLPEETVTKRAREDKVPYDVWARDGLLETTPGNVIDQDEIAATIQALAEHYHIVKVGYDPWNATQLALRLQHEGADLVPVPQTMASLSAATKEVEALVLSRKLRHGGHPVLRWCAANTVVEADGAGNLKPSKRKSTERIDGIVALVIALSQAMRAEPLSARVSSWV